MPGELCTRVGGNSSSDGSDPTVGQIRAAMFHVEQRPKRGAPFSGIDDRRDDVESAPDEPEIEEELQDDHSRKLCGSMHHDTLRGVRGSGDLRD